PSERSSSHEANGEAATRAARKVAKRAASKAARKPPATCCSTCWKIDSAPHHLRSARRSLGRQRRISAVGLVASSERTRSTKSSLTSTDAGERALPSGTGL